PRANPTGLTATANLAWPNVVAVTSAVSWLHVREGGSVAVLVDVHSVSDFGSESIPVFQNPGHSTRCDIHNVIVQSTSVRESAEVSGKYSQPLLLSHWCLRNPGIQPHKVRNRPCVFWSAAWTDRGLVLHQRQQIGSRSRSHWNSQRPKQVC